MPKKFYDSATQKSNLEQRKLMQSRIWLGVLIGSTIGGLVPALWHADPFSYASVWLGGIGGFAGLWIGYKMS